jgi:hypothetical protein
MKTSGADSSLRRKMLQIKARHRQGSLGTARRGAEASSRKIQLSRECFSMVQHEPNAERPLK